MNILFLSQIVPYPPHGGVLQRGYNLIREIGARNQVHLLAFIHPETLATPALLEESKVELEKHCSTVRYFSLWPKRSAIHRYAAVGTGLLYPYPFSVLAHTSKAYRRVAREILGTQRIDVLHLDTIGLAPYRNLDRKVACVLTHHNIESQLMERRSKVETGRVKQQYIALQAKRLRAYEALQSPRVDVNIMVSPSDEVQLREIAPGISTAIVPNGVDTEYFKPSIESHETAAIYTGGMNMYANKDAVLYFLREIWPMVAANHPAAKFYVIGQDPPRQLCDIANQNPNVVVTGFVDDVRPYVRKAAVYVVPLRVGGGTRLKVLDALAQGKAIVSTSVGCEGIAVTDRRDILIEDDPAGFAAQVSALFDDADRRRTLGLAGRELAERKYGWGSIGAELHHVYESVANRTRA